MTLATFPPAPICVTVAALPPPDWFTVAMLRLSKAPAPDWLTTALWPLPDWITVASFQAPVYEIWARWKLPDWFTFADRKLCIESWWIDAVWPSPLCVMAAAVPSTTPAFW